MTAAVSPGASMRDVDVERARDWFVTAWSPISKAEDAYEITHIEGEIPPEINGTLFRNGPSQKILPPGGHAALHLFDGDGLVHAFRLSEGRAWYRGRFVEDPTHLVEQEEGRYCMHGVTVRADDPTDRVPMRQQHNTNVVWHGGKLMALVENAYPFEIDASTLGPVGENTFGGKMLGFSTSAHPKIDSKTGQMMIHGYQPLEPYVQYYVVEPDGRCSVAEPVEMSYSAMMHDMAITENYAIFIAPPVIIDTEALLAGEKAFAQCLRWEPEKGLRFGVRRREAGSEVRWFRAPTSAFMFHPGNAYEEDGKILMDACSYLDGPGFLRTLCTWRRGEIDQACLARPFLYELDLKTGDTKERQLDDVGCEFPRLDDRLVGYRNRYGYVARVRPGNGLAVDMFAEIMKYDRQGGPTSVHDYGSGHFPSEPVFVPRAVGADEDDGFVLNVVFDATQDSSYLAVLDARNLDSAPLAKAHMSHRVPLGFHGNFVAGLV